MEPSHGTPILDQEPLNCRCVSQLDSSLQTLSNCCIHSLSNPDSLYACDISSLFDIITVNMVEGTNYYLSMTCAQYKI
jgi:hypothetical protein